MDFLSSGFFADIFTHDYHIRKLFPLKFQGANRGLKITGNLNTTGSMPDMIFEIKLMTFREFGKSFQDDDFCICFPFLFDNLFRLIGSIFL